MKTCFHGNIIFAKVKIVLDNHLTIILVPNILVNRQSFWFLGNDSIIRNCLKAKGEEATITISCSSIKVMNLWPNVRLVMGKSIKKLVLK